MLNLRCVVCVAGIIQCLWMITQMFALVSTFLLPIGLLFWFRTRCLPDLYVDVEDAMRVFLLLFGVCLTCVCV